MENIDHYFLGDATLHQRLCISAGILAELVRCAPRGASVAALKNATGYPVSLLEKHCRHLCRAGLLQLDEANDWLLAGTPADITLEDVFRSVLAQPSSCGSKKAAHPAAPHALGAIELLLMQATVGIHQHIFNHLRRFPLDRLKISAAGMFPKSKRHTCDLCFEEAPAELH
jgi:DNA-binding IscR family transcriptional regulator